MIDKAYKTMYITMDPGGRWDRSEFPHRLVTLDYDSENNLIGIAVAGPATDKFVERGVYEFLLRDRDSWKTLAHRSRERAEELEALGKSLKTALCEGSLCTDDCIDYLKPEDHPENRKDEVGPGTSQGYAVYRCPEHEIYWGCRYQWDAGTGADDRWHCFDTSDPAKVKRHY